MAWCMLMPRQDCSSCVGWCGGKGKSDIFIETVLINELVTGFHLYEQNCQELSNIITSDEDCIV